SFNDVILPAARGAIPPSLIEKDVIEVTGTSSPNCHFLVIPSATTRREADAFGRTRRAKERGQPGDDATVYGVVWLQENSL
ncbi:MAG: hypothetical protein AB7T18_06165, partial [Alphaproteobacteria bacterium]